jgi:hypothetical protein
VKEKDVYKTLGTLSLACLAAFFFFAKKWLLLLSLIFLVLSLFNNRLSVVIAIAWLRFSTVAGKFNSKLVLAIVFYMILFPVATLFRVFNKDIVRHFKNKREQSYYIDVNIDCREDIFNKLW